MKILIADSGGTSTDWCLIDESGKKDFFATDSYHPNNWNHDFIEKMTSFWRDFDVKSIDLYFFGAGCLHKNNSDKISNEFQKIGFNSVKVQSDLHAAAYSSLGREDGEVAIMGTGSVLFSWRNQEVENIIGGKGHLLGDEGSAYYFGKILLEAYLQNQLSIEQKEQLEVAIPNIKSLEVENKFELAQLAFELAPHKLLFENFHMQNFNAFIQEHILAKNIDAINIVGSYGTYNRSFVEQALDMINVEITQVIEKPIVYLIEQKALFIE
ncbi:MAG: hypothetical protein COA33_008610 [Fluviicola sp.]|nr:hypothetical protein [Fluviicola sp.]